MEKLIQTVLYHALFLMNVISPKLDLESDFTRHLIGIYEKM